MKLTLLYGVQSDKPTYYVNKEGKLVGTNAPLLFNRFYFLFDKFNITLVDLGESHSSSCYKNGLCNGLLSHLQTGRVDFAGAVAIEQFPVSPINITLEPILSIDSCYLLNKPNIEVSVRTHNFIDVGERFDLSVFLISLIISFGLILLVVYARFSYRQSITAVSWNFFRAAFNSEFLPLIDITSAFDLIFVWLLFFMSTIFFCSLQTGLIRHTSFKKIETLQDVVDHNYILTTFNGVFCRYSIEQTMKSKSKSKIDVLLKIELKDAVKMLNDDSRVFILSSGSNLLMKGKVCAAKGSNSVNTIYTSQNPVAHLVYVLALSTARKDKINRAAVKYAYSAFESFNFHNRVTKKMNFKYQGLSNFYSQCLQSTIIEHNIIVASLNLRFFNNILIIFFIITIIGTIVFVLEVLLSTRYHRN